MIGNCARDNLHAVERCTLVDPATITGQATIEDGTVFTRPWTIGSRLIRGRRGAGEEYWEDACHEGDRSAAAVTLTAPATPGDNKP